MSLDPHNMITAYICELYLIIPIVVDPSEKPADLFPYCRVCHWHLSYRARIRPGRLLRLING